MGATIGAMSLVILLLACSSSTPGPDAAVGPLPPLVVPGAPPAAPAAAVPAGGAGQDAAAKSARPVVQVRFDRIQSKRSADKPILRRGVRPHLGEVRACYERGLARAPGLHGQLEVALAIRKGGKVARARMQSTTLGDRATASCVVRAARRWSFRGAAQRVDAVVRFKFYRG